jgi:hypothetical protein
LEKEGRKEGRKRLVINVSPRTKHKLIPSFIYRHYAKILAIRLKHTKKSADFEEL